MKNERIEILQKVANGELTPKQAYEQLLGLSIVVCSGYTPYDLDLPNGLYKILTNKGREGTAEMFYGHWFEFNFEPLEDEKVIGFS